MSFSFGVYFSVDLALVTEVLPNAEHSAAKNLGILNVAGKLPRIIAPALAPLFLFCGGQEKANYDCLLFSAELGVLTIISIKS
jgi:hypothetical protein